MKLKDKKEIVNMLFDEWDLGDVYAGGKRKTCAWIYFCEIMEETERIIVKKENDKII